VIFAKAEQLLLKQREPTLKPGDLEKNIRFLSTDRSDRKSITQGKDLLEQLRSQGHTEEYQQLLNTLSNLHPEDDQLVEMSGNETTNIDIDFDQEELEEPLQGYGRLPGSGHYSRTAESEILILSEDSTVDKPIRWRAPKPSHRFIQT
jgi:hypothetical protein